MDKESKRYCVYGPKVVLETMGWSGDRWSSGESALLTVEEYSEILKIINGAFKREPRAKIERRLSELEKEKNVLIGALSKICDT